MAGRTEERPFIIGSRGSRLARWQAEFVAERLDGPAKIKIIRTSGDVFLEKSLQKQDTKGFFTKEIEEELLAGSIDLAVHSLKDLPTELPEGLVLGGVSYRASHSDLLLVRPEALAENAFPLAPGAKIGATSLRRQSLLRRFAPDLEARLLRGNVPTRIEKLHGGEYDAIIIARAGVERLDLDLSGLHVFELDPETWLPAPAQAVMGVEIRQSDTHTLEAIRPVLDPEAWKGVRIERELLTRFEGGCHAAFGALALKTANGWRVLLGRENAEGRWLAARVESGNESEALEEATRKLKRILENGREEEEWEKSPCRKIPWPPLS